MVPLVLSEQELKVIRNNIDKIASEIEKTSEKHLVYKVGSMIELPKAVFNADKISSFADFLSFGTNDLTQTVCGISRDDSVKFMQDYKEQGIFEEDPFVSIDDSVYELMKIGVSKARSSNNGIKIGICGEHAGDPISIDLCQKLSLDYISCSPYRIPIAKISAAQSAIRHIHSEEKKNTKKIINA